jgi:hypothetical protein
VALLRRVALLLQEDSGRLVALDLQEALDHLRVEHLRVARRDNQISGVLFQLAKFDLHLLIQTWDVCLCGCPIYFCFATLLNTSLERLR